MPTYITLDCLLEPESRRSPWPAPVKVERAVLGPKEKTSSNSRLWASPALYATPAATPLPDSPSSPSLSPYVVNHKRRGPRRVESRRENEAEIVEVVDGGQRVGEHKEEEAVARDVFENLVAAGDPERDFVEPDDFFDAFEEISSESGTPSCRTIEKELQETRLNVLVEIERRKQAEEALQNLQDQWQRLSHQLSLVGLKLPAPPTITEDGQTDLSVDPVSELCQQVVVAQAVAAAVGSGCSRAEIELKMETEIEAKNFEIVRLCDRIRYYEAANKEMSQRNQKAVEMARQQRLRRNRRQKWLWGSVGLAVTLGAASLAWSYFSITEPFSQEIDAEGSNEN